MLYDGRKEESRDNVNRFLGKPLVDQEFEKSALFGRKKEAPNEMDALINERNQAIEAYKQNVGRLDQLNPQAKADINQAMQTARTQPKNPQRPIQDFGEYFTDAKPAAAQVTTPVTAAEPVKKLRKGRLGLIAGGTALAAGTAGKMGYDKWKEEKVAFSDIREMLEKSASSLS